MSQTAAPLALLGGSAGALSTAIAAHLIDEGWDVAGFDHRDADRRPVGIVVVLGDLVDGSATEFSQNVAAVFAVAEEGVGIASETLAEGGSIVLVSPSMGVETTSGIAGASVIQRGVLGLVRGLAVELGDHAIRANAVLPGILDDQDPLPGIIPLVRGDVQDRRGTSADIADAVAFLLSDDAAYVTGVELVVDGGLSQCRTSGSYALWDAGVLDAFGLTSRP
ncbi:MAG: SDR family oxidoreductase [Actinomycetota bacterium]|nr:SDR family oxidoreductase [Actinomycetota bacterium]